MVERRAVEDGSLLADGISGSSPPPVYGTDRICVEPHCQVRLSRYNSTSWCALHESEAAIQRPYDSSLGQRGRRRNKSSRSKARGTAAA